MVVLKDGDNALHPPPKLEDDDVVNIRLGVPVDPRVLISLPGATVVAVV